MIAANAWKQFHDQVMRVLEGKSDRERSEALLLHDVWRAGCHYEAGEIICHGELLYKCLIAHDSQADWIPSASPSLWAQVMYREGVRVIPEVIESTGAFEKDERGWWGDELYKSLIDANVWTPAAYPEAWEAVQV